MPWREADRFCPRRADQVTEPCCSSNVAEKLTLTGPGTFLSHRGVRHDYLQRAVRYDQSYATTGYRR